MLGSEAPTRIEGAFYNRYAGVFRANEFLPGPAVTEIELDAESQERKAEMLACFASQERTLAPFSRSVERFRSASHYRFEEPPHEGPLNYETLGWGITFSAWSEAAHRAETQLMR